MERSAENAHQAFMADKTALLKTLEAMSDALAENAESLLPFDDKMCEFRDARATDPAISWLQSLEEWERFVEHLRAYRKTVLLDLDNLRRLGYEKETGARSAKR